jgi:3-oxoacyl-[acyl-carrier protein] reductase
VNMSSLAARNGGGPGAMAYGAAKAGLLGFTRGLAKELAPRGITVNAVAPGLILETPFHDTFNTEEGRQAAIATIPLRRGGVPDDVAGAVLFLVSDLAGFITGEVTEINGGAWFK